MISRRTFLTTSALAAGGLALRSEQPKQALISISLDLEMARNFPNWTDTHWDYEKGNLNDEAKRYAVEAARRVKAHGGVIHYFLVASVLEQENIDWLKQIRDMGHFIGNHSYDHVYVRAETLDQVQFKFARAPWLLKGETPLQAVRENIKLATAAIHNRLGIAPAGFRTPGGFADGLTPRPDVQKMFLDLGYKWVSCKYPAHPNSDPPGTPPGEAIYNGIVKAQKDAQPFTYPTGLIDVPMSPLSDIVAFRGGKWDLDHFLKGVRLGIEWAIERGAVYDFLSHPAVLYVKDPQFQAIELICDLVKRAGDRARIVGLDELARRAV
jgi:hypothetical protein